MRERRSRSCCFSSPIEPEEFFRSRGGCASDFFQRNAASSRNLLGDQSGIGRLATLSAKWYWSEIRAIGLHHETVHWNFSGNFSHLLPVLECDNPGKGNKM